MREIAVARGMAGTRIVMKPPGSTERRRVRSQGLASIEAAR